MPNDEQQQPELEQPPTWEQVTSDPKFGTLDIQSQKQVLAGWAQHVRDYGVQTNQFTDSDSTTLGGFVASQSDAIDSSNKPRPPVNNGVGAVEDAAARALGTLYGGVARSAEGLASFVGATGQAQEFKQKALAVESEMRGETQTPGLHVNPALADTATAGLGKLTGDVLQFAPSLATGGLSSILQMTMQVASQASAVAKDNHLAQHPEDEAGATHEAGKAALMSTLAIPAYYVAGKFGGKVAEAWLGESANTLSKILVGGAIGAGANVTASTGLRAVQGQPLVPETTAGKVEAYGQDIGFGLFGATHQAIEQSRQQEFLKQAGVPENNKPVKTTSVDVDGQTVAAQQKHVTEDGKLVTVTSHANPEAPQENAQQITEQPTASNVPRDLQEPAASTEESSLFVTQDEKAPAQVGDYTLENKPNPDAEPLVHNDFPDFDLSKQIIPNKAESDAYMSYSDNHITAAKFVLGFQGKPGTPAEGLRAVLSPSTRVMEDGSPEAAYQLTFSDSNGKQLAHIPVGDGVKLSDLKDNPVELAKLRAKGIDDALSRNFTPLPETLKQTIVRKPNDIQQVQVGDTSNQSGEQSGQPLLQPSLSESQSGYAQAPIGESGRLTETPRTPEKPLESNTQNGVGSLGPGAASSQENLAPQDRGQFLSQRVSELVSTQPTLTKRMSLAGRLVSGISEEVQRTPGALKEAGSNIVKASVDAIHQARAVGSSIFKSLTTLPEPTTIQKLVGDYSGAEQVAGANSKQLKASLKRDVPDLGLREAMKVFNDVGGDKELLQHAYDNSTGAEKARYGRALNLSPNEKVIAANADQYYKGSLGELIDAGAIKEGIADYVNRMVKMENPVTGAFFTDLDYGNIKLTPSIVKQRLFKTLFDLEQAGYKLHTYDLADDIGAYDETKNKLLAARAMVKSLPELETSKGLPMAVPAAGEIIEKRSVGADGKINDAVFIQSKFDYANLKGYRPIDNPAFDKWEFASVTPDGKPIIMRGQMWVHEEGFEHVDNVFGRGSKSWFKTSQNPLAKVGNFALEVSSLQKGIMFFGSGFHQIMVSIKGGSTLLGEGYNPFARIPKELVVEPGSVVHKLMSRGMFLSNDGALSELTEGLRGAAWFKDVPALSTVNQYHEYLFKSFIPRWKAKVGTDLYEVNSKKFAGKYSEDQILALTAKQVNNAIGLRDLKFLGANKTYQDVIRGLILAPDYSINTAQRFGSVVKPGGLTVVKAIGIQAAAMFALTRLVNKSLDDDYHWNKPFSFVINGHEFGIRTEASDALRLLSYPLEKFFPGLHLDPEDTRKFFFNRINPTIVKPLVEGGTGRDYRGVPVDFKQQAKDWVENFLPIAVRSKNDVPLWTQALFALTGAYGKNYSDTQQIRDLAQGFGSSKKAEAPGQYVGTSKYHDLNVYLLKGDVKNAKAALEDLRQTTSDATISKHFNDSVLKPFTGDTDTELKFVQSLDSRQKERYVNAINEQKKNLELLNKIAPELESAKKQLSPVQARQQMMTRALGFKEGAMINKAESNRRKNAPLNEAERGASR